MKKREKIELEGELFSSIEKINIKNGDTLIFSAKTDEYGVPYYSTETLLGFFNKIKDEAGDVHVLMIPDKISLIFLDDYSRTIRTLENFILDLKKAAGKVGEEQNAFPAFFETERFLISGNRGQK